MSQSDEAQRPPETAPTQPSKDNLPAWEAAGVRRRPWNQWRLDPDPDIVETVHNELIFEGDRRTPYLFRFFTLLILSVFIASFGLFSNSSAVVIAAMIVAPLMTPIMGIAIGLITGSLHRQYHSGLLVLIATITIAVQAFIIGFVVPEPAVIPSQILSRTDPAFVDLLIAIAAGAAGGYSIVRREASSALAGVAIGVSLVPPLSSYGILLAWGERSLASGALLLYLTNLVAIVFTGAIVFSLVGFLPINRFGSLPRRIKLGFAAAAISVIIIAIPLYFHSEEVISESADEETVSEIVNEAIDGTDFELINFDQEDDEIIVSITGPASSLESSPATPQNLADELAAALRESVELEIRFYPYGSFPAHSAATE